VSPHSAPPASQERLRCDGAVVGGVARPVTCAPRRQSPTLRLSSSPNSSRRRRRRHGLQLSPPLRGRRGSEGGLPVPAVPEGPSVVLPAPGPLRGGALRGRPAREGATQK